VLTPRIAGSVFLDAYAGSGAVGIEAISRGAKHALLIEHHAGAIAVIRENLHSLGIETEATILRGSAIALLTKHTADIAFIDPPYEKSNEYSASLTAASKTGCSMAIAQHSSKVTLEDCYGALQKTRVLKQGDNSLSFYERNIEGSTSEQDVNVHDVGPGGPGFE